VVFLPLPNHPGTGTTELGSNTFLKELPLGSQRPAEPFPQLRLVTSKLLAKTDQPWNADNLE
jgi:hypothetical protein